MSLSDRCEGILRMIDAVLEPAATSTEPVPTRAGRPLFAVIPVEHRAPAGQRAARG